MLSNIDPNDLHLRQIALENALRFHHGRTLRATTLELAQLSEPDTLVKTAVLFEDFLCGKTEHQTEKSNN